MDVLGEGRFSHSEGLGEGRFPQSSFLSIAAGFVIVCGSLYLLTSTASWNPQQGIENEPPTPLAANGASGTTVDITLAALAPDQAHTGEAASEAAAHGGDEAPVAGTPASQKQTEPIEPSPSSPQAEDATLPFGVAQIPEATAVESEPTESMMVSDAGAGPETLLAETTAAESADPETPVAAETTPAPADQIGQLIAEAPSRTISTQTIREDTGDVPDLPVAESEAASDPTDSAGTDASLEATAAVIPRSSEPESKREPEAARATARSAPTSRPEARKQNEARPAPAQQAQDQPRNAFGLRLPMGLAPANRPVAAPAKPRSGGAAYSRQVWAALARSKPRAGQKGSATVVFSIGASGNVGSARIARSSGNSRIDQLALTTVRRAGFPAPPSGGTSFSIRIDFD